MRGARVELFDKISHAGVDVVSYGADFSERPIRGIGEIPVDVSLARDVRALIAAPHGDNDIGPLGQIVGEFLGAIARNIDADFAHRIGDHRVDMLRRTRARRARLEPAVGRALKQRVAHLGPTSVLLADEEDLRHRPLRPGRRAAPGSSAPGGWPTGSTPRYRTC